ncbi:MAG: glycerol-3-phosphate 1-O-acyltransferase PlsY [Acidimicrobiales bacterium]
MLVALVCIASSYLIGTFPSALLVGRRSGVDPTRAGSGNPGTTNVLRTAGRQAALLTLAGDAGKGALAAVLGWAVDSRGLGVACGLAAVVGHVAPATRRFRGGKGVATAAGMVMALYPALAAVGAGAYAAAFAVTRIGSVASLTAAVVVPTVGAVAGIPGRELAGLVACEAVVVLRHSDNIRRIGRGQEGTLRP